MAQGTTSPAEPALRVPDPLSMMSSVISSSVAEMEAVDAENQWWENVECGSAAASENFQVSFNWNHGHLVYCHSC